MNGSNRRVVITGIVIVSSLGQDVDTFWKNIINGKCGIQKITLIDPTDYACQIASEVHDFDPTPAFPSPKEVKRSDRYSQFAARSMTPGSIWTRKTAHKSAASSIRASADFPQRNPSAASSLNADRAVFPLS